ncbi:MAG: transcriptional regulator [Rheinheimera sp.]|uniref:ArsR/SmtB family transcription factor n=1 Tax=Arsukibacterium sp. UBA3155 TaxID=1946058 RepID=UPI000C8E3012|nr:helix-turn-helix transcriptional regulator [Arsukibacterium sp. UBA3155]MAD73481.1 transcriptional regulator [Rheinheimera sp.]|tara:strand:+ start:18973 stop:19335 length:363 start_codon:yes stop_codon:yes gene_type:complete
MNDQQLDRVFLALANSSRRQLMDLVAARPGCTLSQLLSEFDISRIGLMKHLQVLLDANLVIAEKRGRERPLYLNSVPLQLIHERWSDQYRDFWAGQLTRLKYAVESNSADTTKVRKKEKV